MRSVDTMMIEITLLLQHTELFHGGLTPEEVLIPFVTLTRATTQIARMPLDIKILAA